MEEGYLKIALDNIVEGFESYFHNFSELRKIFVDNIGLKRQLCRNWKGKGFLKHPSWFNQVDRIAYPIFA